MVILEDLKKVTQIVRKGKVELSRDEILELCDIIRYIPDKDRVQVYDYLLENDPLIAERVEKETMEWIADFLQNVTKVADGESPRLPRQLH